MQGDDINLCDSEFSRCQKYREFLLTGLDLSTDCAMHVPQNSDDERTLDLLLGRHTLTNGSSAVRGQLVRPAAARPRPARWGIG